MLISFKTVYPVILLFEVCAKSDSSKSFLSCQEYHLIMRPSVMGDWIKICYKCMQGLHRVVPKKIVKKVLVRTAANLIMTHARIAFKTHVQRNFQMPRTDCTLGSGSSSLSSCLSFADFCYSCQHQYYQHQLFLWLSSAHVLWLLCVFLHELLPSIGISTIGKHPNSATSVFKLKVVEFALEHDKHATGRKFDMEEKCVW